MEKEITVKVKVFDDPEYCNSEFIMGNTQESCEHLFKYCDLFKKICKLDKVLRRHVKCEACKKAFQESN